jgi:hypothetical protein
VENVLKLQARALFLGILAGAWFGATVGKTQQDGMLSWFAPMIMWGFLGGVAATLGLFALIATGWLLGTFRGGAAVGVVATVPFVAAVIVAANALLEILVSNKEPVAVLGIGMMLVAAYDIALTAWLGAVKAVAWMWG